MNADQPVDFHLSCMERAIELSRKCQSEPGKTSPMVGALVVKDGQVLGEAFRGEVEAGEHAEFVALERKLGDTVLAGSTVYTTLEPCTTRHPPKVPCAERLVERKVARVVIGMLDPNPAIRGNGVRLLRDHNIDVELFPAALGATVEDLNRHFRRTIDAQMVSPEQSSALTAGALSTPRPNEHMVVFMARDGRPFFVESTRIRVGTVTELRLIARNANDTAGLSQLRQQGDEPLPIAFRLTAMLARVTSVVQTVEGGEDIWDVRLEEDQAAYGDSFTQEIGFGSITSDDIARLRARRILLNEKAVRPGADIADPAAGLNDSAFEMFVRGFGTPFEIPGSPFPELWRVVGSQESTFLTASRLLAVLWLRLSIAVERILQLDLKLVEGPALHVHFSGERARRYSNEPAPRIEIDGVCPLDAPERPDSA